MRDGPPSPTTVEAKTPKAQQPQSQSSSSLHDTAVGPVPATSTTTLLKEISTLRSRLRDLEDDTKSSVSMDDRESQLSVLLRRELAQVQQEQAQQQLQFMNQLAAQAAEHDRVVQTLQQELTESKQQQQQNENDETRNPDQERVWILLETERQTHAQQLQRLTANMESADLEIAHCRRDMDELSQALDEMVCQKEDLLEEVTRLRLDVQTKHAQVQQLESARDEARKQVQTKENEVGSMNDLIVSLEDQKAMLVEEVTQLKGQLYKQQQQQQSTPRHHAVDTAERPITPTEKKHLEAAVEQLETRLVNFTAKLQEKDETIQQLAATLQEERLQSRSNNNETVVTVVDTLSVSAKRARDVKDHASEVSFLRNQNKLLNDELKAWKRKELDQRQLSPVRTRGVVAAEHLDPPPPPPPPQVAGSTTTTTTTNATSSSPLSTPQRKRPAALVLSPRGAGENQSRGAGENKKNLVSPRTPVSGLVASFERRMVTKKPESDCNAESLTASLELMQQDLDRERLACQDLQKKLRQEKAVVSDLRAQLDRSDDSQELQHELQTSLAEIQRLQSLVDDYQSAYAQLETQMLEEQEKAERLLSEQEESEREIKSLSDQLVRNLQELDRLKAALQSSNSSGGEEKKEEEVEEISRLKEQVGALQSELETAWQRGEELEAKLKESHTKMAHDAEINRLTIELTNTQMLKDELEKEYEKNLTDLEKEFEELEAAADQELDAKQRVIDDLQRSLREKEEEVARLDSEKSHLCDSMNNLSFSRRDEVDDMQAELLDATAKTTAQQREIAILKGKIEDYQAELSDLERNSKKRIAQLEEDLAADNGSEEYEQVKAENVRLRESIKTVRHERRVLKERLDSLVADKSNSKSAQILRDRNSALKEEVEKLTKRLKKMEASITRFAI